MELPIKIDGNNILIDELNIVDEKFCSLTLGEKIIIRKTFCKAEYTHENGLKHFEELPYINEDIMLSSELMGVEMGSYIRDSNSTKPFYMKILLRFRGGWELFMCFEDTDECRRAFKIVKQYFNYINGL